MAFGPLGQNTVDMMLNERIGVNIQEFMRTNFACLRQR